MSTYNLPPTTYHLSIAGSTSHTLMCAEALLSDPRFSISWILTPSPRLVGRKQELVKNPMHLFAEKNNIPVVLVDKKIDEKVKEAIASLQVSKSAGNRPTDQLTNRLTDFLLVVDFGYFIPNWLLEIPTIAPINVHPSELPKYRGSSPGQFTLLYGDETSAVSVIIMNDKLDEGDLVYQYKFDVLSTWTADQYYQFSFEAISEQLPNVLTDFAQGKITAQAQLLDSPTPIARRLTREDGFVEWEMLQKVMKEDHENLLFSSPLLTEAQKQVKSSSQLIEHAVRALSPWPGVWTVVPTTKGEKRMKILSAGVEHQTLVLEEVQIEGQQRADYSEIKRLLE